MVCARAAEDGVWTKPEAVRGDGGVERNSDVAAVRSGTNGAGGAGVEGGEDGVAAGGSRTEPGAVRGSGTRWCVQGEAAARWRRPATSARLAETSGAGGASGAGGGKGEGGVCRGSPLIGAARTAAWRACLARAKRAVGAGVAVACSGLARRGVQRRRARARQAAERGRRRR